MAFYDELASLLLGVTEILDPVVAPGCWTIEPGSPASRELANNERRKDGTRWGEGPVRQAFLLAQITTAFSVEMARNLAALLSPDRPSAAQEVLARSGLDASSTACWLLDPELTARQRVCRLHVLKGKDAREGDKARKAVRGHDPQVDDKLTQDVEDEGTSLGLMHDEIAAEKYPNGTERVDSLMREQAYLGTFRAFSGTVHAQPSQVWKMFRTAESTVVGERSTLRLGPDPVVTYVAVHSALWSMIMPTALAERLFGWSSERVAQAVETIERAGDEMARLSP